MNLYVINFYVEPCFDLLIKSLLKRGYLKSEAYSFLFTKEVIVLVINVGDEVIIPPDLLKTSREVKSLQELFNLTDDTEIKYYPEARLIKHPGGSI